MAREASNFLKIVLSIMGSFKVVGKSRKLLAAGCWRKSTMFLSSIGVDKLFQKHPWLSNDSKPELLGWISFHSPSMVRVKYSAKILYWKCIISVT